MATKDISDLQVVQAFRQMQERLDSGSGVVVFADQILHQMTGQPMKVCGCAMERAYSRGLVECGVTLRSGWLTDAGAALVGSAGQ